MGPYATVSAVLTTPIGVKRDLSHNEILVDVPQIAMIAGTLVNGTAGVEYHGGVAALKRGHDLLTVYGLDGTLRYYFETNTVNYAEAGADFKEIEPRIVGPLPQKWLPEQDFAIAVQAAQVGKSWSKGVNLNFADGVSVMRKIEAIHVSASTGRTVALAEL